MEPFYRNEGDNLHKVQLHGRMHCVKIIYHNGITGTLISEFIEIDEKLTDSKFTH